VLDKVKEQMDILPFSPRRYTNLKAIEFAEKLVSYFPSDLKRVLFAPGGTSAVGMALKLARVITGKTKVVSWHDSFHGASLDAIGAGGEEQFKKYMGEFPNTINISQPVAGALMDEQLSLDLANEFEAILKRDKDVGAFIAETIRNTDVIIPSKTYWKRIREICTEYDVLLILDEIPIAFGKTGTMLVFEHYDIEPDIVCLGKGLGAAIIPIAGIVTREAYNVAADVSLGHYTFEKNPLGSAAGLAMLEYIENESLLQKVKDDEAFVREQLNKLKAKHSIVRDVRGIGLLWGVELIRPGAGSVKATREAELVMYYCLEHGLSFKVSNGNVLQLSPPIVITREELTSAFLILDEALKSLAV
jgi:4-aminobutyrate aminotransferase